MYYHLVLLFQISVGVISSDLAIFQVHNFEKSNDHFVTRNPKFIDIYTNHEDLTDVINNYRNTDRRQHRLLQRIPTLDNHRGRSSYPYDKKITYSQLEDTYLDRIDFHYPNIDSSSEKNEAVESDFGTIIDQDQDKKRFVFLQSQKVAEATQGDNYFYGTRRPKFKTQKYIYTNIQKIPKLNHTNINKYEELDIAPSTTKNRINTLLRHYLAKLYAQKYNTTTSSNIRPSSYSKVGTESETEYPKTKFLGSSTLWDLKNKTVNKIKKLFSIFTIVEFNHTQCNATNTAGTYQGICYTASECSTMGGTTIGNCADGYGVCCVFLDTCGGSSSQNCSYFQSPNYPDYYPSDGGTVVPTTVPPTGSTDNPSPTPDPRLTFYFYRSKWGRQGDDTLSCVFNVYKVNSNVSKMRIDFLDLELTGPTNGTCVNERLIISGQNTNNQVPVICGYNTGQHVYVDVSSLMGPLQLSVLATMSSMKRFRIRICQFEDSCLEPSSNCLQYYTGVTGMISSFNYDQASMLSRSSPGYFNNLNYAICIRREEGYCSITYRNVVNGVEYPFQLVNVDDDGVSILQPGQAGADILNCPDDYIVIGNTRLCGDKFNDGSIVEDFTMNAAVTDTGAGPIVIPVRTDSMVTGLGFKLFYTQNPCMTTF